MSASSSDLGQQLPFLRRFARAVTGGQKSGDAYVSAFLNALLDVPDMLTGRSRADLCRGLLCLWNSIDLNRHSVPDAETTADDRLQRLSPHARQAFLLVTVEDFSIVDAAHILNVTTSELRELLNEANRTIAAELASDVLIIEDEPLIALDLEHLVNESGHRAVAVARTHKEAVASLSRHLPDIVLADIQLADGSSGIAAVNEILSLISVPVVFVTAYPERLLTGQAPEPAFVLSKPFEPAALKAVISQALFFNRIASPATSDDAANPHSIAGSLN